MKFRHSPWRKLYREEQGAFAQLPWLARAAGAMLLKPTDDDGRIHIGPLREGETRGEALTRVIAFRMGATRSDRRMMPVLFEDLFGEGYLVLDGEYVRIRNFVEGQAREPSATEPRRVNEPATNRPRAVNEPTVIEPRSSNEPSATAPRTDHEPTTKTDSTSRKLDTENASAPARAQSSEERREESTRTEERERGRTRSQHAAGPMLWLDGDQLAVALANECSRFHWQGGGDFMKELHRLAMTAKPTALTLDDFVLIGQATAAGAAFAWCEGTITVSRLVANGGKHLFDALAEARTWDRDGRKIVARARPAKVGAAKGPMPVSTSFAEDDADPFDEILAQRREQNERDRVANEARKAGGSR